MDNATIWNIIDTYFQDNPQALVRHHIDSYNDFFKNGIFRIFKETKPITLYSRLDSVTNEYMSQCKLYMGGKDGSKIYFGKPVIHDDKNVHFMFPNEARMRNMNYSMTIHYDIEVEFLDKLMPGEAPTVIGPELLKETQGGGISLDIDGESYKEKEKDRGSISDAVNVDWKDKQTDPVVTGEKEEILVTGGAPKNTMLKKKKDKEQVRLAMTTNATRGF